MERPDVEKPAAEDGSQLNRNRSFKSKQLVRSQAIRESQSPPRTLSPSPHPDNEPGNNVNNNANNNVITNNVPNNVITNNVTNNVAPKNNVTNNVAPKNNVTNNGAVKNNVTVKTSSDRTLCDDDSDVCNDVINCGDNKDSGDDNKKQPVEIQITGGTWDEASEQRQRTRRWLGHRHCSDSSRDLLSNSPRVACVCGACAHCPHCRGRRRRHVCPIKQDSGIACSDDCPDCTGTDSSGGNEGLRKSESLDVEEQTHFCRCPERKEKPKNSSLSRTDSEEKTEPTGAELVNFLKETLNKNARDRLTLLKIERELRALVSDTGRCIVRFPVMTSYGRMLVHRCAALFQLSHHLDHANKTSVLVSKSGTSGGRMPCTQFKAWCTATFPPSPQRHAPDTNAKSILKRDTHSLDEPGNGSLANSRSKSLEQREKDYERMKRRIFSTDNCSQDESQWPWLGAPVKLLTPETGRNKLLKVQSLESSGPPTSSSGCRGRGAVSKSHSFGGYAGTEPPHPRLLSRQGDLASSSWRLSPSSSGYKTLSLRSTDSVTPSPTGGASPEPCSVPCTQGQSGPGVPPLVPRGVVWCVTDMAAVPPGALLIHPQTGRPLANPDGSVYRYDPANPPMLDPGYPPSPENKSDQNEKKRGKLEKQHSFMDHNECECPPTEETRNKCCCECRRHETQDTRQEEKTTPEPKSQKPQSPCKNRYDQEEKRTYETPAKAANYEPTNQRPAYPAPTNDVPYSGYQYANERQVYEPPANQRPPSYDPANREQRNKLTNQESQEMQYNQYGQQIRPEEHQQVTSPPQPQCQVYHHQDVSVMGVPPPVLQAKVTPVPMPDPNMRPVSLTNVVYPAIPQGYPYMNQCRMPLQPVYQPAPVMPAVEEQKLSASPQLQESTFRIDPSYPYAAVDYAAQCGACVDPNAMRSYNVSYGQVHDMQQAVLPPAYPVGNVILPQPHLQPFPYQEAVQWPGLVPMAGAVPAAGKILIPEPYPPVYHNLYAQYSLLYPQVVPPSYPMVQPMTAGSRRNSADAAPATDEHTHPHTPTINNVDKDTSRRNSTEIAVKIQQIKEQMALLNTRGRGYNGNGGGNGGNGGNRRDDWRRRAAPGLLGSCPPPHHHAHHRPVYHPQARDLGNDRASNEDAQLSTAARAIVNSIRNIQAKNSYQDNRRDYQNPRENRPRRDRSPDKTDKDDARRHLPPMQYRPPYLLRQMSPGTWCRRSPGPVHPVLNNPRRPHPDTRNGRR